MPFLEAGRARFQSILSGGSGLDDAAGVFFSGCLSSVFSALTLAGASALFAGFLGAFLALSAILSFLTSWESPYVMGVRLYFGSHSTGRFLSVDSRK